MVWLMKEEERPVSLPPEWRGIIPTSVFLGEAERIVAEGEKQGIILRVMGGVAARLCAPGFADLAQRLSRLGPGQQEFTDLDFMSYSRFLGRIKQLFASLGYRKRKTTLSTAASARQIYFHPQGWFFVDVFFDWLRVANHPLDFRKRLELGGPTIPVTDLLLEKLQIVNLSEKDLKDSLLILLAHPLADEEESRKVNAPYLARLLARDWGFWYTVTTNLEGIKRILPKMAALGAEDREVIARRADDLLARIVAEPKSIKWKARAQVGTRMRWYEPVETMETVGGFGIWRMMEEPPGAKPQDS